MVLPQKKYSFLHKAKINKIFSSGVWGKVPNGLLTNIGLVNLTVYNNHLWIAPIAGILPLFPEHF